MKEISEAGVGVGSGSGGDFLVMCKEVARYPCIFHGTHLETKLFVFQVGLKNLKPRVPVAFATRLPSSKKMKFSFIYYTDNY